MEPVLVWFNTFHVLKCQITLSIQQNTSKKKKKKNCAIIEIEFSVLKEKEKKQNSKFQKLFQLCC